MNLLLKDAFDKLEAWALSCTEKDLATILYPAFMVPVAQHALNHNLHWLRTTRTSYNFLTYNQRTLSGTMKMALVVEAFEHHYVLRSICQTDANIPRMLLAELQYRAGFFDDRQSALRDLLLRSREVLHHWTQLLYGPYISTDLRPEILYPTTGNVENLLTEEERAVYHAGAPRQPSTVFKPKPSTLRDVSQGIDGTQVHYLTDPPKLR